MSVHESGIFDGAIMGCDWRTGRLIYSVHKCVRVLMRSERMAYDEALDHLESKYFIPSNDEDSPIFLYDVDK